MDFRALLGGGEGDKFFLGLPKSFFSHQQKFLDETAVLRDFSKQCSGFLSQLPSGFFDAATFPFSLLIEPFLSQYITDSW